MATKESEISNEVVARSRFLCGGALPIAHVRRIVEFSGYRSIWGNSNRQLTLAPIDRDKTLSLEDNCMLITIQEMKQIKSSRFVPPHLIERARRVMTRAVQSMDTEG